MTTNYYALLKVKRNATPEEINEAYEKLYLKYNSRELLENCFHAATIEYAGEHALEWMEIEKAYAALSNSADRVEYDEEPAVVHLCHTFLKKAVDEIENGKEHGKLALEMLNVMAYLNPKDIPILMFVRLMGNDVSSIGPLLSCASLFRQYSLIHYKLKREQLLLSVHRMTQHITRLMLKKQNMEEAVLDKAVNLLGSITWDVVPYKLMKSNGIKSETKGVPKIDLFYPHVEHILSYVSEYPELNEKCSKIKRLIEGLIRADHLNETKNLPYKLVFTDEGFSDP